MQRDPYAVLGIPHHASAAEVKRAFRTQVKRYHPDLNKEAHAAEMFRSVHRAYQAIGDPASRRIHDDRMEPRFRTSAAPPRSAAVIPDPPATPHQRLIFRALHATGLLFGCLLLFGVSAGIVFMEWPLGLLLFTLPGVAAIPESWAGLRPE